MQRRLIDSEYARYIRNAYWEADSPRSRSEIVQEGIAKTGYSRTGFYRKVGLNVRKKKPSIVTQTRLAVIDKYAKIVWDHQLEHSKGTRKIRMAQSYRFLVTHDLIPSRITYDQIAASIRRQHLKRKAQPLFLPFERKHPLSQVQIDFTRSAYFTTLTKGKKECVKIAYSKGANGSMARVWLAVAIDDASRVAYAEYYITSGESAALAQEFMLTAFSEKTSVDEQTGEVTHIHLLQGTPKQIYTDRGSGFKNGLMYRGLNRMGIEHIIGGTETDSEGNKLRSSNKQARGKVERMIQELKGNFETMMLFTYKEGAVLTLAEINEHLRNWLINSHNNCAHPRREGVTRWQVFEEALDSIKYPHEEAALLFYTSAWKTVHGRQVQVEPGIWCRVPYSIASNQRIEVHSEASTYYTMIDNKRIALEVISDTKQKIIKAETVIPTKERDSDHLEGLDLRSRLSKEIEKRTNQHHSIGTLPESLNDDIAEFLLVPRSIKNIRECAVSIIARAEETGDMSIAPSGELIESNEK